MSVDAKVIVSVCGFPYQQTRSSISSVPHDHVQTVMGLTLFEDLLYWTDGKSKSLRRAHKTTGEHSIELLNSWQAIESITIYHPLRQPEGTHTGALAVLHLHES